MAKLGALIVKGFRSKPKFLAQRLRPKKSPARRPMRGMVLATATESRAVKVAARSVNALATPPTPIAPITAITPTQQLSSTDLMRPDERLQKSIESFLLDQRSEHTRRAYGKDLKRFIKFLITRHAGRKDHFGPQAMPEILTRGLVIGYKDFLLSEKLQHTTVDRHLATLRSFFRWLVEDGLLDKNPAENVRFLNPKRESPTQGFSNEEVVRILSKPNLHYKVGSLHYAILMVLFFCGLRRSEVCDLRTSLISIEKGQRFLRLRGKGNRERIVILTPAVWNAIRHYLKMNHKDVRFDQPLFTPVRNNRTSVKSKALDPSTIFYIVKKYSKLAGVQARVSPHSCRATAISNARDHQVPDRAIQEFAGWTTPNMITRYDKRRSVLEKSAAHAISYGATDRDIPQEG